MRLVEARNLRKTYAGDGIEVRALDDVDLDVESGEFVAVMGPSGSGKSTLLHMLGALDVPDAGCVVLDGKDLSTLSRAELAEMRRRSVGMVFQFFNLVPVLTVEENVSLPAVLDGKSDGQSRDRAGELLRRLGLADVARKLPSQVSGGEQQRVAIARALINEPRLLLADEPTGNLDRRSGSELMTLLCKLHDDGQTVVVVTHDPAIASFARRVVFMRDGKLVDSIPLDGGGDPTPVLERLTEMGQ
jgi:putative ABC transport system ATP-binding protein